MNKWLINPFRYISGWPALFTGLAGIAVMSVISAFTKTHLDGVIDVHYASSGDFTMFISENLITWGSLMLMYGIFGLAIAGRTFRLIDLAGYTAFIRLPFLIAVIFPFIFDGSAVADFIIYNFLNMGKPVEISTMDVVWFIVMTLLTIVIVFWSLMWGYFAYKTLFNTKGLKAAALYFIIVLLSEVIVKAILYLIYKPGFIVNIPT
ncbi:MAG: hypothetical protein K9H84_05775 [Bacteroidales bacterium]|nr:hypothetical protein [Bacteroidales bacterium]